MKLFWRRPLCFACCLFLMISFAFTYIPFAVKSALIAVIAVVALSVLVCFIFTKKNRRKNILFIVFMCVLFGFSAMISAYLRIDIPQKKADEYEGINTAEMLVLSKETDTEYRSEYIVRIKRLGGDQTNIKAVFICDGAGRAEPFDTVFASVDICPATRDTASYYDDNILLTAYLDESVTAVVDTDGKGATIVKALSNGFDGLAIYSGLIRNAVSEYITSLFGDEVGGLAAGLLMNDKSGISSETVRDFRRSGVSHLLAVSGLHISLLIGAVELLLKKLRVPKNARYPMLAVSAICLLALAGFSMSACRSVFMLFVLYSSYLFFEGNDSPTSLFLSVTVIILISPSAIYDLGLFMSFAATLGLVTFYPIFESFSRRVLSKRAGKNILFKMVWIAVNTVAITVIANIFLLPVSWIYFGEISLASVPVNLLVSPVIMILLPLMAVGVCLGRIFIIGDLIVWCVGFFGKLLMGIASIFSRMPLATVSLKYGFVTPILLIFIVAMAVFLVIDVKKKWVLSMPALISALAFVISLVIFNFTTPTSLFYYSYRNTDVFLSVDNGGAVIVDTSLFNSRSYDAVMELAKENTAVYLKSIVITSPTRRSLSALERLTENNILERVLLPRPENKDEAELVNQIYLLLNSHGVVAELYDSRNILKLSDGLSVSVLDDGDVIFACNEKVIYYTNAEKITDSEITDRSDVIVIGSQTNCSEKIELSPKENRYVITSAKNISSVSDESLTENLYSISYPYYTELHRLFE